MEQEKVEKLLRAKLKERGLKITQQRLLVLSTLAKSGGNHMAAEELLNDVRNYLDITYSDTDGDTKLIGIITRGMAYLDDKAGKTLDYEKEGQPRALLLDYCRYARNSVLELFEQNFHSELIMLRIGVQTDEYAEDNGFI